MGLPSSPNSPKLPGEPVSPIKSKQNWVTMSFGKWYQFVADQFPFYFSKWLNKAVLECAIADKLCNGILIIRSELNWKFFKFCSPFDHVVSLNFNNWLVKLTQFWWVSDFLTYLWYHEHPKVLVALVHLWFFTYSENK